MLSFNEPLKGESGRAFDAFRAYCELGSQRSLNRAYRKATGFGSAASGRWTAWSQDYQWAARASLYDAHMEASRRKILDAKFKQLLERRAEYEIGHHDRLVQLVERMDALLKKAEQAPITDVTVINENGQPTKVKGVKLSDVSRLIDQLRQTAKDAILGVHPEPQGAAGEDADVPTKMIRGEFTWVPADATEIVEDDVPPVGQI